MGLMVVNMFCLRVFHQMCVPGLIRAPVLYFVLNTIYFTLPHFFLVKRYFDHFYLFLGIFCLFAAPRFSSCRALLNNNTKNHQYQKPPPPPPSPPTTKYTQKPTTSYDIHSLFFFADLVKGRFIIFLTVVVPIIVGSKNASKLLLLSLSFVQRELVCLILLKLEKHAVK